MRQFKNDFEKCCGTTFKIVNQNTLNIWISLPKHTKYKGIPNKTY